MTISHTFATPEAAAILGGLRWVRADMVTCPECAGSGVCGFCGGMSLLPGRNQSSAQKSGSPHCWHCNGGPCSTCNGSGVVPPTIPCPTCQGMGDVAAADEPERIDCFTCGGRGTLDSVHVGIVDPARPCEGCAEFDPEQPMDCPNFWECDNSGTLPARLVATAHLTPMAVVEYPAPEQYPCVYLSRWDLRGYNLPSPYPDVILIRHPVLDAQDVTDQFPEPPVPGEWWWWVTDLRPLDEPISEYERVKTRCTKPCLCECHEPLLSAIHPHHGKPCPGKLTTVPIDVAPGLSPCPEELAREIERRLP